MTALTSPAVTSLFGHAMATAVEVVVVAQRRLADAWRHRHDAAVLAGLDDHMLADIGLTRMDLNDALSGPLWRDPTAALAQRQRERRFSRRPGRASRGADLIRHHAAPSIVPDADAFAFPPRDPPARLTL
ncbi:MAG TPA: DUF1127 domain-containing protein [Xanthobacteraceae bacterium]